MEGREGKNHKLSKIESKCYHLELFKHFISYIQQFNIGIILFWFFSGPHERLTGCRLESPGLDISFHSSLCIQYYTYHILVNSNGEYDFYIYTQKTSYFSSQYTAL